METKGTLFKTMVTTLLAAILIMLLIDMWRPVDRVRLRGEITKVHPDNNGVWLILKTSTSGKTQILRVSESGRITADVEVID